MLLLGEVILTGAQRDGLLDKNHKLEASETKLMEENAQLKETAADTPVLEDAAYRALKDGYIRLKDGAARWQRQPICASTQILPLWSQVGPAIQTTERDDAGRLARPGARWGSDDHHQAITGQEMEFVRDRMRNRLRGNRVVAAEPTQVKGEFPVENFAAHIPWNPDRRITVWMHLTDSGYTTCWGHRDINLCSKEVLQEKPPTWEDFFADQYDRDFKLGFDIERNFEALPVIFQ